MSNYYLCDRCRQAIKDFGDQVLCAPYWPITDKCVMFDYHGEGGRRYDDPTVICPNFKPREDE